MRALKSLGIVSGVLPWIFIMTSISLSPWFNIFNDALSDLGNTNFNAPVAYIFDVGLVLSGLLAATFGLVLSIRTKSWKLRIWSIPLTLASANLSLIGAFNEAAGAIHSVVSVIFFLTTIVTLLLFSYVSWPLSAPALGGLSLVFGIFSALIWMAPWPWGGVAIQETVTSAIIAIMLILLARRFA